MVPTLARAYLNDVVLVQAWYFRSVKVILVLGLPIAAGGSLVALPLIIFLYGEQYLPAVLAFQIIVWDVPLLLFTSFCGNMTTVVGAERSAARILFIAAITNIVLNLLLIPMFSLYGAAAATLITDLVAAIQFYFVLGRRLKLPNMTSIALRVAAATGVMSVVVVLMLRTDLLFLFAIAAGGLSYAGMVLALRILDEQELGLLRRLVRKIGGAAA